MQRERLHELNAKVQRNRGGRSDSGKGIVAFWLRKEAFGMVFWLVGLPERRVKLAFKLIFFA